MNLHVICERDVGLFSLIQQVIANIPWALEKSRVPVAYFMDKTCYWTPQGYKGCDTVWEYYFEPVVATHPASVIPESIRSRIRRNFPRPDRPGYRIGDSFVSNHFGDHPELSGLTLSIPYLVQDPDQDLRATTALLIRDYVRPRPYILSRVETFYQSQMANHTVIGVHIRGTDAVSEREQRPHRQGSLDLSSYVETIEARLEEHPDALILVATDEQRSIDHIKDAFEDRVIAYESIRHLQGDAAGEGPTGWIMPSYIASDRDIAARNGEEAVIEYLLLCRCNYLIHNGSGLARTVLLQDPELPHQNTHSQVKVAGTSCPS